jgi:hypothetical protein
VKGEGRSFTGFASGATKGLWCSQIGADDRRLIVAETAIDASSYAALKYQPHSRYVSTAGELNPDQPFLLEAAIRKLPLGGEVVRAVDHHPGRNKIGKRIEAIFQMIDRPDLAFVRDLPLTPGDDWNDQLRAPGAVVGPPLIYRPKFASR